MVVPPHCALAVRLSLLAASLVASLTIVSASQQAPPPAPVPSQRTFRTSVDLVTLTVTVLDKQRRPVKGLTLDDFTVLEEGESRPVVAVETIETPMSRPAGLPVWHDEAIEDVVSNAPKSGRLVVLFFDRSIGRGWETDRARKIAARAIAELGPEDVAAVVYNYHLATPLNFTSDRQRLLVASKSPVIGTQDYDGQRGDCFCGLCGVESVEQVAKALEPMRGRPKLLIYMGSGIPLFEDPSAKCAPWLRPATASMFAAAQRTQMVIHVVDPSGVRTSGFSAAGRLAVAGRPNYDSLRRLAENTGGGTLLGTNTPDADVPRIFQESVISYLIGFKPRAMTADGKPQSVRVHVRGRDLTVLAASTYMPASPADMAAAPPLPAGFSSVSAIAGLSPVPDIAMRASAIAVPDAATPDRAAIATVLGMDIPVGSATSAPIAFEVEVAAFDTKGRPQGADRQTMTLTARPGATTLAVEMLSRLSLPKGRFEIRAAVSSASPALTGSLFTFVDVENFGSLPLAVSGLIVQAPTAVRLIAADRPDTWLPAAPTTYRAFARDARVTAALRLVRSKPTANQPVEVVTQVVDARGARVSNTFSRVEPRDFDARGQADVRVDVPVSTLVPGEYLLKVAVTLDKTKVARTARFSVR